MILAEENIACATADDSDIVRLFFERDQTAIAETEKKYGKMLKAISQRIVGDSRDAEECVSDTYLKLWNSIPPQKPNSLCAYAGRIARNLSLDLYRRINAKKRQHDEIPLDELSECIPDKDREDNEEENAAIRKCLNEFLASIPQEQRIYFMRRYWMCESLQEISERYGVPENNLAVMMFRLRKKLAKHLEKNNPQKGEE